MIFIMSIVVNTWMKILYDHSIKSVLDLAGIYEGVFFFLTNETIHQSATFIVCSSLSGLLLLLSRPVHSLFSKNVADD